jgi:hypothetical protein
VEYIYGVFFTDSLELFIVNDGVGGISASKNGDAARNGNSVVPVDVGEVYQMKIMTGYENSYTKNTCS